MEIKLSQECYQDLIVHILQYGSKELKESHEAFGLIYGIRAGNTIDIKKSVPVSHGVSCTNPFTETDLVTFSSIDKKMSEDGLECFGFYISHPDMGYYLAQNEIKNLLHFHNDNNQDFAFAIICDHAQMEIEEDFGIKAMRLKNPEKGTSSDFEKLDIHIEAPHNDSLFRLSKFLIEQGQKHQPYINEQGVQLEEDDSLWDAFDGSDDIENKAKTELAAVMDELKKDIQGIETSFINTTLVEIYKTMDELNQFVKKPFENPTTDLLLLRESLEKGILNVQEWFDIILNENKEKIMKEFERTFNMVNDAHVKNLYIISKLLDILKNKL